MFVHGEDDHTLREVVQASAAEINAAGFEGLSEGLYFVGTGNTGAAATLATLAGVYGAVMLGSSAMIRRPPVGYSVAAPTPTAAATAATSTAVAALPGNVAPTRVMSTPQFWQLATMFFCVASGGSALFSVAKPLFKDVFVTAGAASGGLAATYLMLLAAGNLGGRIGWALFSDKFGRRATFQVFTLGSIPIYLSAPYLVDMVINQHSQAAMWGFIATTVTAISFMGGTYALLPAYEADLFGSKHVGAIHGRTLLASTAAALAGPSILIALRGNSEADAFRKLLDTVDPVKFRDTFGASVDHAQQLIDAKTLTIARLLEVCPAGTADPTPFIYDSTMLTMSAIMAAAAAVHQFVKPVDHKYFDIDPPVPGTSAPANPPKPQ